MIVEQVWTGNSYRNFNYLIACPETGEALAIDPLDFRKCLDRAADRGWTITQIVNTHEHPDHTGGNKGVVKATGAKVIAHHAAGKRIPNMDRGVHAGDIIRVGKTVELECMDTPGHTMSMSVCYPGLTSLRCSVATRCSTRAPATATTAVIRKNCSRRSRVNSRRLATTR